MRTKAPYPRVVRNSAPLRPSSDASCELNQLKVETKSILLLLFGQNLLSREKCTPEFSILKYRFSSDNCQLLKHEGGKFQEERQRSEASLE